MASEMYPRWVKVKRPTHRPLKQCLGSNPSRMDGKKR